MNNKRFLLGLLAIFSMQAVEITETPNKKARSVQEFTSKDNFGEMIAQGIVVLDLHAPWCGPCRAYKAAFEVVADELVNQDKDAYKFISINIDEHETIADKLQVRSIPLTIVYRNGKRIGDQSGNMSRTTLKEFINRVVAEDANKKDQITRRKK